MNYYKIILSTNEDGTRTAELVLCEITHDLAKKFYELQDKLASARTRIEKELSALFRLPVPNRVSFKLKDLETTSKSLGRISVVQTRLQDCTYKVCIMPDKDGQPVFVIAEFVTLIRDADTATYPTGAVTGYARVRKDLGGMFALLLKVSGE